MCLFVCVCLSGLGLFLTFASLFTLNPSLILSVSLFLSDTLFVPSYICSLSLSLCICIYTCIPRSLSVSHPNCYCFLISSHSQPLNTSPPPHTHTPCLLVILCHSLIFFLIFNVFFTLCAFIKPKENKSFIPSLHTADSFTFLHPILSLSFSQAVILLCIVCFLSFDFPYLCPFSSLSLHLSLPQTYQYQSVPRLKTRSRGSFPVLTSWRKAP